MGGVKQLVQGSDLTIDIQLIGEDGEPIHVSNCQDVILYLYQERENILLQINKSEMGTVNNLLGKLRAQVLGATTKNILGRVNAQVTANVINPDWDAGFEVKKFNPVIVCDVINSVDNDS